MVANPGRIHAFVRPVDPVTGLVLSGGSRADIPATEAQLVALRNRPNAGIFWDALDVYYRLGFSPAMSLSEKENRWRETLGICRRV